MTKGSDSAFTVEFYTPNGDTNFAPCQPLTKREYFAAMALQGFLANDDFKVRPNADPSAERAYATQAVLMADALIEALNK